MSADYERDGIAYTIRYDDGDECTGKLLMIADVCEQLGKACTLVTLRSVDGLALSRLAHDDPAHPNPIVLTSGCPRSDVEAWDGLHAYCLRNGVERVFAVLKNPSTRLSPRQRWVLKNLADRSQDAQPAPEHDTSRSGRIALHFEDGGSATADVTRAREAIESANPESVQRMICEQGTVWWHAGRCWWVGRGDTFSDTLDVKKIEYLNGADQ